MLQSNTMQDERQYQRESTKEQRQFYLDTDVMDKIAADDGYRRKVEMIEQSLRKTGVANGWILDVGAGTCGEDEYLSTRGFKIICTDVNDVALAVSKERSLNYGRPLLEYAACDGQSLPFDDNSISTVLFNESLHHMPDARASLKEVARVLAPGGGVCMLEPYAYDPWRRLSEIRDYFRGTIEKSFSISQIRKMCDEAGLDVTDIQRPIYLSRAKLNKLPGYHRVARRTYYSLREAFPSWLGMILLVAKKRGGATRAMPPRGFEDLLRCPVTKTSLIRTADGYISSGSKKLLYPINDGVPVLIADEAKQFL